MFITLYRQSPEGCISIEIEQTYLPNELVSSLQIPNDKHIQEAINAGWCYWFEYSELSDRQILLCS